MTTTTVKSSKAQTAAAARHPWARAVRRSGWVAKGLVYTLISYLCLQIAIGGQTGSAQEASAKGAFHFIAVQPGGTVLLLALSVGLFAFAADRLLAATLVPDPDVKPLIRVGLGFTGVIWAVLGVLAVKTAISPASTGSSDPSGVTATLMQWSFGPWIVAAAGLALFGFALIEIIRAVRRDGSEDRRAKLSKSAQRATAVVEALGLVGHGIAFALVGYFLLQAALTHDPQRAQSLDGALLTFTGDPLGSAAVIVTALGLLLYAVHCFIQARMRRLEDS